MSEPLQILCIDDDEDLLEGLTLSLRKFGEVHVANRGEVGLLKAAELPRLALVICDMRMPGLSGAETLAKFRVQFPTVTRVLLTGFTELDAAIAAVNQGNLFRFLSKPVAPSDLQQSVTDALAHHQLLESEKELLNQTLRGSVEALATALSMSSPAVFGLARRTRDLAASCAQILFGESLWSLDTAALLLNLGLVGLSTELQERYLAAVELDDTEEKLVAEGYQGTLSLLAPIPRLEQVRDIIRLAEPRARQPLESPSALHSRLELMAEIIAAVNQFVRLDAFDSTPLATLAVMRDRYLVREPVMRALTQVVVAAGRDERLEMLTVHQLREGMQLSKSLYTASGMLLAPAGYDITEAFLLRLRVILAKTPKAQIAVRIPARPT